MQISTFSHYPMIDVSSITRSTGRSGACAGPRLALPSLSARLGPSPSSRRSGGIGIVIVTTQPASERASPVHQQQPWSCGASSSVYRAAREPRWVEARGHARGRALSTRHRAESSVIRSLAWLGLAWGASSGVATAHPWWAGCPPRCISPVALYKAWPRHAMRHGTESD